MLSSRNLDDLATPAKIRALKFLADCKRGLKPENIDILVTCTRRDSQTQDQLYAHGRTRLELEAAGLAHVAPQPGPIVTNAKGGDSFHNYGCAFDVVPVRNGKPVWSTQGADGDLWQRIGAIGERCELEWAGRWAGRLREEAHFQYTRNLTLAQFKAGARLENGALA